MIVLYNPIKKLVKLAVIAKLSYMYAQILDTTPTVVHNTQGFKKVLDERSSKSALAKCLRTLSPISQKYKRSPKQYRAQSYNCWDTLSKFCCSPTHRRYHVQKYSVGKHILRYFGHILSHLYPTESSSVVSSTTTTIAH